MPDSVMTLALREFFFRRAGTDQVGNATHVGMSDPLFMFILWLSIISFVGLMGAMTYFVIKYRRRPGVPTQRSPSHNTPLETAWSVGPLLLLVIVFFWGFWGYIDMLVSPAGSEEITITGQRWNWAYTYSNGNASADQVEIGVKKSPVIYVPAGRPVKLVMSSVDVLHSFYIPDFRMKMDVFPNRYTSLWFQAERPGEEHWVFCAEYCGQDHSEMAALIRTVTPEQFEEIKWKEPEFETPALRGEYLKIKYGCVSCHSVDGSAGTGPTWKDLFGQQAHEMADGSTVVVDENYIRESIYVPGAKIVRGYTNQMNSYQGIVTARDLNDLIAYMKSISVHASAGAPAPESGEGGVEGGEGSGG